MTGDRKKIANQIATTSNDPIINPIRKSNGSDTNVIAGRRAAEARNVPKLGATRS
jgi:hypothetical protein